jgi:hypothetical protein
VKLNGLVRKDEIELIWTNHAHETKQSIPLISTNRYGIRTMLKLPGSDDGIFQKDVRNQEISNKYLDLIIHALKASARSNVKEKKRV